ncbi:MAG: N-acetylneuraminate synthase [Methanobacteriota archaeon]|nr:MAG: N-acetylneuraminate synthase [Euryarchaeota archaeon]
MPRVKIGARWVGDNAPTYFIADIGANHDGTLDRAKKLIRMASEAGADAAKFQNFRATEIVSKRGFESLGKTLSHQAKWKKSVFEVYQDASLPWEWTPTLKEECDRAGIEYFSAPYDLEAVDMLDPFIPCFKIGSGDITWPEILRKVASKGKPVILSTGASDFADVKRAVETILAVNPALVLLQCNTNYTGSVEGFKHVHLRVLDSYRAAFPEVVVGLSDHTPGIAAPLGAVALGARVVEKHFTDDRSRTGPDHPFSMTPTEWRDMVDRTRELELALGRSDKEVAENERETYIVQRRCLRAAKDLKAGTVLARDDIVVLRPAPTDGIFPYELDRVLGKRLKQDLRSGDHFRWAIVESRS